MTVLAFRASFSGIPAADVLGIVDPLAAPAPSRDCVLRDAGQAAVAMTTRGDAIELEELAGVGISFGELPVALRPSPRMYPDVNPTIGGVVGEAGPVRLTAVPADVRVVTADGLVAGSGSPTADVASLGVPATGWVRLVNGVVPRDGLVIETKGDLNLSVGTQPSPNASAAETAIELRPLGATIALSCVVPGEASLAANAQGMPFVVSRQALGALLGRSGAAPGAPVAAALDLVRRSAGRLPVSATRVSVEVRTSTFVEIRP